MRMFCCELDFLVLGIAFWGWWGEMDLGMGWIWEMRYERWEMGRWKMGERRWNPPLVSDLRYLPLPTNPLICDPTHHTAQAPPYQAPQKILSANTTSNTAQVIFALVEELESTTDSPQIQNENTLPLLQEAIELFQRCLALQKANYEEYDAQTRSGELASGEDGEMGSGNADVEMDVDGDRSRDGGGGGQEIEEERWATIVSPPTATEIVDTVLAQLNCLAFFATRYASSQS